MPKHTALCPAPGCTKVGDFARNFCNRHYLEFRAACIENGSWGRDAELPRPVIPKFEWLGDEQALIDRLEKEESEKQNG
jgi:hypothetical protein